MEGMRTAALKIDKTIEEKWFLVTGICTPAEMLYGK